MKWGLILLFLVSPLYCDEDVKSWTPIFDKHDTTTKIDEEFRGQENGLQSQKFTVFQSTPFLSQLKDGQVVIVSSATYNKLMWRFNQEIYAVNGSCVTVYR